MQLLFAVVLLDLIGFGIVIPILPFLSPRLGADNLDIAYIIVIYALCSGLFAPYWGRLSDRFGRRPVILLTITGTAGSLAMLGERADAAAFLLKSSAAEDEDFRQWLAERLLHLSMRRSEMTSQLVSDLNLSPTDKQQIAAEEIAGLVPEGNSFIMLDENDFGPDMVPDRKSLPFLEQGGQYWGPPADDEIAIRELERMRQDGAGFVIILWPAFWWFDFYHGLRDHLYAGFRCVLSNSRLIAFDLREPSKTDPVS